MRLFAGMSSDFITLNLNNQIADLLRQEFLKSFGFNPSQNEVMSWRNSLLRVALIFQQTDLTNNGVFVEYQLPLSGKRIDIIVCGKNANKEKNAVIIELKQWEKCSLTDYDSEYVLTWVGGGNRNVLHPSVQVGNYKYYLQENNSAFYEGGQPIKLSACSYLHNYNCYDDDALFDVRFREPISRFPVYTADNTNDIAEYLKHRLSGGDGEIVLGEIENSKLRPSKKLLHQVSTTIKSKLKGELRLFGNLHIKGDYILLDEQLVVYDNVISLIKTGLSDKQKHTIIVKGGAGTGKSVIALQLLADLTALGTNTHYATGSKSFTETLRKILGNDSKSLLKYFMSYGEAKSNEIDVLLMDEAHRIRERTGYPFKSTGRLQVQDLMNAAKVSVFFIDDYQIVRNGEIGSVEFIKTEASKMNNKIYEYELEAQFRCGGSDGYTNWIDNTLNIRRTANALWSNEENFEVKIFDTPENLENAIIEKSNAGFSARLVAGFCWPWSNELVNGELINDIEINNYKRPWNAREGLTGMKKDIPKSQYWAYETGGINQIGCVYTAQGFEFDYAGVIFGNDLVYNPDLAVWEGNPKQSFDNQVKKSDDFLQLVKNTYRVLLSRGMKGCYIYFTNKDTERFFKSRIENYHS